LITEKEILLRIQQNPDEHLASYDLEYYHAYWLGYTLALYENGITEINIIVSRDKFEEYLKDKYQLIEYPCNIRYESYLELITSSKKDFFDLYISEQLSAARDLKIKNKPERIFFGKSYTVEECFGAICKRPGMYFGNNFSSMHIGSFILGYKWASKDYSLKKSVLMKNYSNFQTWYDTKEPFSIGYPWYKTMLICTFYNYRDSFYCFLQDYTDFLEGKDSDFRLHESVNIALEEIMKNQ